MRIEKEMSGNRIRIRNYEKSDLDFVTEMWLDEVNGKYLSDPTVDHVDAAFQKALDSLSDSQYGYYLIIEHNETGTRIGSFSIFPDEDGKVYDIGYCIHRDYWHNGYGSEALALMLGWMKDRGAEKVTAEVAIQNEASNALLRKFGFEIQTEASFEKYNMGIHYDSLIYAKTLWYEERMKW